MRYMFIWAIFVMGIIALRAEISVTLPDGTQRVVPLDTELKCYRYGGLWTIERIGENNNTIVYCDMKFTD